MFFLKTTTFYLLHTKKYLLHYPIFSWLHITTFIALWWAFLDYSNNILINPNAWVIFKFEKLLISYTIGWKLRDRERKRERERNSFPSSLNIMYWKRYWVHAHIAHTHNNVVKNPLNNSINLLIRTGKCSGL